MNNLPDFSAYGYQVKRLLGHNAGGGRVVYQALSDDQQMVVIKQFQFAKGGSWSGFKSIEREIHVLQGLDHESTDIKAVTTDFSNSQIIKVAAVTFANGGDNIGIYIPLFASSDAISLGIILSTFLIGIALWCYVAYLLSRQPAIAHLLTNYGHRVMPFVLIGLGIYILVESETYRLLPQVF